jgi:hypothetical protein
MPVLFMGKYGYIIYTVSVRGAAPKERDSHRGEKRKAAIPLKRIERLIETPGYSNRSSGFL